MAEEIVKGEVVEKAASILAAPVPSKEPGQRSANISDLFLTRFTPPWSRPASLPAYTWRAWVLNQAIALVCRETLISSLESLDWKIVPKDMKYREELAPVCKYYTNLLTRGGNYPELGLDYTGLLEWIVGDFLDIPFGGGAEIGRKNDLPNGRVMWIKPLDGGTLYPTLNRDYPVVQYYQGYEAIAFPQHAIARVGWSPHPYLFREGWFVAPPEKIYFALDLLNRGDKYYANLLTDVPTAGILDLGDMEAGAAQEWISAFRTFVNDTTTSFKIPVLYEHNNKVEFLPFGKPPADLMFDRITLKYAALVCGGYGVTLGDIGLQTSSASGETLAGSIRQERKTRRTGFARTKSKWTTFVNQLLPDSIEYKMIDYDEEQSVGMGRARLASATAFNIYNQMGAFSAQEVRSQSIQDGLINISIPDKLPPDAKPIPQAGKPQERPGAMGNANPASSGGYGELKALTSVQHTTHIRAFNRLMNKILGKIYPKVSPYSEDELWMAKSMITSDVFDEVDSLEMKPILEEFSAKKVMDIKFDKNFAEEFKSFLPGEFNEVNLKPYIEELKHRINEKLVEFLGRSIVITALEALSQEGFDTESNMDYDSMVRETQSRMMSNMNDYVTLHVSSEVEDILDKIRKDNENGRK